MLAAAGLIGIGLAGKMFINYKRADTDQSLQSWLLERLFGLISYPLKKIESRKLYEKGIEVIGDNTNPRVPAPRFEGIKTEEVYIENMQTLIFNDKNKNNQAVLFFLHGGAYIFQPAFPHFNTVEAIIRQTDAKVVMPIYPKVPNYDFTDAYPTIIQAYRQTVANTASIANITFMGDSAGGGLALGLSSLLAHENLPQPRQLILISPWLDARAENPNMKKFEASDTLLPSQYYFQTTGRLWARGEDNLYHPLVSPLYTTQLDTQPPIYILVGGDEMLYPDILRFKAYMEEAGGEVHLYVKEGMVHDYAIFNTPEGEEARAFISERIRTKN